MRDYNLILLWNDDNHSKRVFVNGAYIGELPEANTLEILADKIMETTLIEKRKNIARELYIFDLPEGISDKVINFFQVTERITIAQEEAILDEDWATLENLI